MRRRLRPRQAAKTSSRLENEDEGLHAEIAEDDTALKRNVVRRRRSLRVRRSLDKSYRNEENRSQETTVASKFLHNNSVMDENVLKGNVVRKSSRLNQPLDNSFGTDEIVSKEPVGSNFLPKNTTAVDENVLKGNVVNWSSRLNQSLDKSFGTDKNISQEITVGSNFLPNNTAAVDENELKGLRPGWWRDLHDSHSINAIHLNPSSILGDTRYDCAQNPPPGWYQHLDLTEIPSFRRTSDVMTRSSGRESYPSPGTTSSPKLHKRPLRQKVTSEINVGDFQDAYDLEDSKHHSNTRSKSLQTSSHNSRNISREHESHLEENTNIHKDNSTKTKNGNIVHSSTFLDTDESPVRRKRPLWRKSKFQSDYQNFDAVLEGSAVEIQDAIMSTQAAQIHLTKLSNSVEHSVSRHEGITESGQSSPDSVSNTSLRIVGHRPFAQKKKRKSSLYKNLNFALEDHVASPQSNEIHTKNTIMHCSPQSESTNSPIKNSSKSLRKNRSVRLSTKEDFTATYEDDTELVHVKDRYKTRRKSSHLDVVVTSSDDSDDDQKQRPDKSELGDQVNNRDHEVSHNKRSQKSVGSGSLLHTTESPVLPNLRPFKKRSKMVRDYQHFEEAFEDSDHSDKAMRSGRNELLLLKRVASHGGPNTLDQISGTSKDLQSIEDEVTEDRLSSPTTSGNVSPVGKMSYTPFARKKDQKSSVYRGLELVLEENSESSQSRVVPRKGISVPSSVPSESSGSPTKKISESPTKRVSKIFQKNKSLILLHKRDLATAFEDSSPDTIDRNKSKRLRSGGGDDDNVASSTNRTVFEKSVQSNIPSDTTGSPVRTNIRLFKKNFKITTDYQHFEEALDTSDSRASDRNKSRKSRETINSGTSREAAMPAELASLKEVSNVMQSSVSNASPAGKMSIKPLKGKKSRKSSIYKNLELALQENSGSEITIDYHHSDDIDDSKTSGRNKSRRSRETIDAGPSDSGTSREAAMSAELASLKEVSNVMQSSVSNASPAGKMSIKPLKGKKSRKSSIYKNLELALQENSGSKITTDYHHSDDIDDSKTSGRNKSRRSQETIDAGPSDSDTSREAAMPAELTSLKEVSNDMQSSISNASPAGKMSIKPLKGKKSRKSSIYKNLELALQENSGSEITTDYHHSDDIDDSKTSGRNKSRRSRETIDAGPSDSDASREAAMPAELTSLKEVSNDMQSSISNASPAGKMSIKPLKGKKSRKSSIYKNLELALQEHSGSEITTDYHHSDDIHDSKTSGRNKASKSRETTDAEPSDSGISREAAMPVEQGSFKEVSDEMQSSVSNASPAGKRIIKPLMGKKSRKSSVYKNLELALQEKSVSEITTDYHHSDDIDDSKKSGRNKSRKSRETTNSGTSREAAMPVEQDSFKEVPYDMQSSVSNASPAGKMSIKPLMGKKSRKSSIYKNLEFALQENSVSEITTDYHHSDDIDDSKKSGRNKSRKSLETTNSGTSREAAMPVEQDSFKEVPYDMQSSVSNASPAGKMSIKPLKGKKSRKSSIYKNLELALQENSGSEITTDYHHSDDIDDSKTSGRNKSRKSRETTNSSTSREAAMPAELASLKEVSNVMQSSVSNASPAGKMSIKPLKGKKSRKSLIYNNLELAIQEKSSSKSDEALKENSSKHTSYSSEFSKSSLRNVSNGFPKNKSVVSSGLSTALKGVSQLSNTVEGTKSNKKEYESFQTKEHYSQLSGGNQLDRNILKNSKNSSDSLKNRILSERSISSNMPSNTNESSHLTQFQKSTELVSGYQNLFEDLEDSDSSMFDRGKITNSTSTQLEHTELTSNIALKDSVPASSHKEVVGEIELSLSSSSPVGKMSHQPFTQKKIRKSSVYRGLHLVSDEKAGYSHKSEVHRTGTSTRSSLPSESSESPIKTTSKPFQKNKSILVSYEGDLEAVFEENSNSSDIADSNKSKQVRSVDDNDIESFQDRLYNNQLRDSIVSQKTEDIHVKNSPQNVVSSLNGAILEKSVQSNIHSDATGSPDRSKIRVFEKSSKITTDYKHFEEDNSRKSSPNKVSRKRSVKFEGIDGQEHTLRTSNLQELHTVSSHKEGADKIQSSPTSLNYNSPVDKMTQRPFTQKGQKSSICKSLESVPEQNTMSSQTSEIPKKNTPLPSGVPSESSRSPTKMISKIVQKNNSKILSNEDDLAATFDDGSYASSDDTESSQDRQHNNQLNGNKLFSKQSEEISAKISRNSMTSPMNHTVSDSSVHSKIPSENIGSPIADNQHFEGNIDSGDSSTSAGNKYRKSDPIQRDSVRQKEIHSIQSSVSNASPARNIPLRQINSQKPSISESLKFAMEENTVFPQTSELHTKSSSAQSSLPSHHTVSPNKKMTTPLLMNKNVVVSNETDFAAALDEDDLSDSTVINTSDIELSQGGQHSSHLRIMNEKSLYLKQDNMNPGHQDTDADTVKLSDEESQPDRKNVKGSNFNTENTSKNPSESKMPPRSQVLEKPSEESEISSLSSELVPVANSTPVIHAPGKKMKYTPATISDASGRSSLEKRRSHIPSGPNQTRFLQNNKTLDTSPFMRNDKSHRQSRLSSLNISNSHGTNMKSSGVEVNAKQHLSQDSSARKIGNNTDFHHSSGLVVTENYPTNKAIASDATSFNKSKGDQFEPSPVVRTNIKKSISRFRLSKEKKLEIGKSPIKRASGSLSSKNVIFSEGTKNSDRDNLLPLPTKGHTNDVSGLNHSLQKNQDLEEAKKMNQERMKKIEENLYKEQKKPRTIQEYFEAMKIANNQKSTKRPRSKPIDPDFLVNGKVYRPPPFKRPKAWVSEPLINAVLKHCEKTYGPIRKRRKAEVFMGVLCEQVSNAMRRSKNYSTSVENTKEILYKFGLIKTLHDFYCFIEDYLPTEFRIKAIPCLRAFGKSTGPPWRPGTNIFQELEFD